MYNLREGVKRLLVVVCLLTFLGSCYGPFNLTRRLHDWNGSMGNEWANEGVFLVCVIFPVYFFSTLGDAIVFNSIEFWGGENPIDPPGGETARTKTIREGDRTIVLSRTDNDGAPEMTMAIYEKDVLVNEFRLVATPGGSTVLQDSVGNILGRASTQPDGSIALLDARGAEKLRLSAAEIARLRENRQAAGES